jgi:hypothetical protein
VLVLARFADVVFGLFEAAGVLDAVGADSLSFLFDAARFGPGSEVTSMGRGSGCCGALEDKESVGTEVAALAARVVEVTVSDVTRNGVLKSDSIGGCWCISGAASSPCGS